MARILLPWGASAVHIDPRHMAKEPKSELPRETTEIIETSLSELDLLTRAFDLIAQVCADPEATEPPVSPEEVTQDLTKVDPEEILVH